MNIPTWRDSEESPRGSTWNTEHADIDNAILAFTVVEMIGGLELRHLYFNVTQRA